MMGELTDRGGAESSSVTSGKSRGGAGAVVVSGRGSRRSGAPVDGDRPATAIAMEGDFHTVGNWMMDAKTAADVGKDLRFRASGPAQGGNGTAAAASGGAWSYKKLVTTGRGPSAREGHTAVGVEDMLIVFGGCFLDRSCFSDVFVLLTRQAKWVKPAVDGDPPPPREGHTATLVGTHMYVYGGSSETGYLNDVYIMDVEAPLGAGREVALAWGRPDINPGAGHAQPLGREGHTATLYQGRIYIFGGYTVAGHTNDMLVLDTGTLSWEHPRVGDAKPPAREGHSTVLYRSRLYVFGGFTDGGCLNDLYVFDLLTNSWEKALVGGTAPSTRQDHSAVVAGHRMLVMAGCNFGMRRCFNDMHVLDLETQAWTADRVSNPDTLRPREDHSAVLVLGQVYLFGGCFLADSCFDDTLVLQSPGGTLRICEPGAAARSPEACSGHGKCRQFHEQAAVTTVCVCEVGFAGEDCSRKVRCPSECSGPAHGTCMGNGQCACKPQWTGKACEQARQAPTVALIPPPKAAAGAKAPPPPPASALIVSVPLLLGGYTKTSFSSSAQHATLVATAISGVLKLPAPAADAKAAGSPVRVTVAPGAAVAKGVQLKISVTADAKTALGVADQLDQMREKADADPAKLQAKLKQAGERHTEVEDISACCPCTHCFPESAARFERKWCVLGLTRFLRFVAPTHPPPAAFFPLRRASSSRQREVQWTGIDCFAARGARLPFPMQRPRCLLCDSCERQRDCRDEWYLDQEDEEEEEESGKGCRPTVSPGACAGNSSPPR